MPSRKKVTDMLLPRQAPREKIAAALRCFVLLTVFLMARLQSAPRTADLDLVLSLGAAYTLVTTFVPWARYDARRATLAVLAVDVLLVTALIYSDVGVASQYYLLYYLPILHAAVRLNFRDAIGTCLLSGVGYLFVGVLSGTEGTVTQPVILRVVAFSFSAALLAVFFVIASRQNRSYQQLIIHYEEAMQSKSAFLSRVSHEFRTPLTAIVGFTQLLHEQKENGDTDSQQQYLTIVREQAYHLANMIEDMLDLSRIEDNKLVLKPEPASLSDLLDSVLVLLDHISDRDRVVVTAEPRTPTVWVDRNKVEQAVSRVLQLAVEAAGGSQNVSVKIGPGVEENSAQVAVVAAGLDPDDEDLMPLVRTDGGTALRYETTGRSLGIAVARALIEQHGGQMWLADDYADGTAICLTLPAYRKRESGTEVILGVERGSDVSGAEAHVEDEDNDRGRRPLGAEAHAG